MSDAELHLSELLGRSISWSNADLTRLTHLITSTLSDALGTPLETLDYSGIENADDQWAPDFLWLRFRSQAFSQPNARILLGGAVCTSRDKPKASGFVQYFIHGKRVRPPNSGLMLVAEFADGAWQIEWAPHDFVEEYDQYTFSYFRELNPLESSEHNA